MKLTSIDLAKLATVVIAIVLAMTGQISWWFVLLFMLATAEVKFEV